MTRWATLGSRSDNYSSQPTLAALEGSSSVTGTGVVAVDTSVKRNAAPSSIKYTAGATSGGAATVWTWGLQGNLGWYARHYFRFNGNFPGYSSGSNVLIAQTVNNPGEGFLVRLVDATHKLRLLTYDGTTETQRGSDSTLTLTLDHWYRIELYGKIASGSNADECTLVIADETTETNETIGPFTGLAVSAAHTQLTGTWWGFVSSADANANVYIADGAINVEGGSSQTGFPGPTKNVLYDVPTGDSARGTNWLNGAAGTTNLWDANNNLPPVGVADGSSTATSQIKNANTADTTGNYDATMQSYTAAGLAAGQYVSLAQSVAVIGSSTTLNPAVATQIVSNPAQSGEDSTNTGRSAAIGTYGSNWRAVWGTAQIFTEGSAPTPGTAPVMRLGRRDTVAGSLEACFMAIAFEVQDSTAQTVAPVADVSAGAWTPSAGGTLFATIDEITVDDADYDQSGLSPGSADEMKVRLAALVDPAVGTGHTVSYRMGKSATGGDRIDITVTLYAANGTTVIKSWVHTSVAALTTYNQTLSGGEADSIPSADYATGLVLGFSAIKV